MCAYSAMVDQFGPKIFPHYPSPSTPMPGGIGWPYYPPNPISQDAKILKEILEIGKRLDRLDKALGLRDCTQEDKAKREFESKLEALIKQAQELKGGVDSKSQSSASNQAKLAVGGIATSGYAQATGGAISPGQGSISTGLSLGNGTAAQPKGV